MPSIYTNYNVNYTRCWNARKIDIARARNWYKITDANLPPNTEFPFREIPFLNQKSQDVIFATVINPLESSWLILYQTWGSSVMAKAAESIKNIFSKLNLHSIEMYCQLKVSFDNVVRVCIFKSVVFCSPLFLEKTGILLLALGFLQAIKVASLISRLPHSYQIYLRNLKNKNMVLYPFLIKLAF